MASYLDALREALDGDEQTRDRIIKDLATHPEEVRTQLISGFHDKHAVRVLVPVFSAIGYPANVDLIPWLVAEVDRNSPAWREVVQAVDSLGAPVIVPYLVEKFWQQKIHDPDWCYDVESVCALLLELDRPFSLGCGPSIAFLLSVGANPTQLDLGFLMDVLEQIGSSAAAYALPHLLAVAQQHPLSDTSSQALKLINSYPADARQPYERILANLPTDH